jgi:RNA polymerase sigma-70 factor, ECF subfamily
MDGEARLLSAVARGDEDAFLELYDGLAPALLAFALRQLSVKEDAEEVVQDTFVRLVRTADRFDPRLGSVKSLAYTIARNLIRSRWRAEGARPKSTAYDLGSDPLAPGHDPRSEQDARVMANTALATLDPLDRALVEAAFLSGHSHGELAADFGMPLGTVKSRLRRALLRLRARWRER